MKRIVTMASLAVLAACAVTLAVIYAGSAESASVDQPVASAPALAQPPALEAEKPVEIDFAADAATLATLTRREREDQYRDWLLYAAVASLGKSADDFNRIMFDLPAIRHGYMRPVGTFEYAQTRSRYVSEGEVLALVPSTDDAAQRHDDLAAIADLHRKNQGSDFKRMLVVEYKLDSERGRAQLTRRGDLSYAQLFSPAYGYVEQQLTSLADLEHFVSAIDDLTFVRKRSSGILVGGRKLQQPQRQIGVEQIATVWQAERDIQDNLEQWKAHVSNVELRFNERWANRTAGSAIERQMLEDQHRRDLAQTKTKLAEEERKRKLVEGTGFSLDPGVDFTTLRSQFEREWPLLVKLVDPSAGPVDPAPVSKGLAKQDIVPLLRMIRELGEGAGPLASMRLQDIQKSNSYQAARYDGNLQGTEVGMVLFYTDLIAKLWTIDYVGSSPARRMIRGFVDDPGAARSLSLAYAAESEKLSQARLWFGPSTHGYQIADQGNSLHFGRIATRIFSAGSNPERPGEETQTSMFLAASIDWWNDHYEEVARHEPEYQRLNQIMKWSALLGWLNGNSDGKLLSFLDPVQVDRTKVFGDWVKRHPELRFSEWTEVGFFPRGYKGSTTEAMPLLAGPVTEGGVSLANRELARQPAIAADIDPLLRRSNLRYVPGADKSTLSTLDGTVFTFKGGGGAGSPSVAAKAKANTKMRAGTMQLQPAATERIVNVQNASVSVETRVDGAPVGSLRIDRAPNGFSIGWRAHDIDLAHALGRRMSAASNPDAVLLADPSIEAVVKFDEAASYAVKLHGSPRWIRFAPESAPRVDIDPAWQMRAAAAEGVAVRVMQMKVLEEPALLEALGRGHFVVAADGSDKAMLRWSTQEPAAGGRMVAVETSQGKVQAWVDSGGAVNLRSGSDRPANALAAARSLRSEDVAAIRNAAVRGDASEVRVAGADRMSPLAMALDKQDFRNAAARIAADPGKAAQQMKRRIADDVARNGEIRVNRGLAAALHDIDALLDRHGPIPELLLRRGVLQIERGNVADAAAVAGQRMFRGLSDRAAFFDEVNARLRRGSPVGDDLYRFAQFVDQRDLAARRGDPGGILNARLHAGHFDFDLTLDKQGFEAIDDVGRLRPGVEAVVYRQDTVALNRIDWSVPLHQALADVISGRLGKVIRLPQGSAADYRPAAVWMPDHQIELKPARPQTRDEFLKTSLRGYRACQPDPETGSCNTPSAREPQQQKQPDVYIVLAAGK